MYTVQEIMQMSDDDRRHLAMTTFGEVFPDMQLLLDKLSSEKTIDITQRDLMLCIHAIYLASIEYNRYCVEQTKDFGEVH